MFAFLKSFVSVRTFAFAAAVLCCGSSARAGLTLVAPTPHATEHSQAQILSHRYGGTFTTLGDGFTNGSLTATRVDDLSDVAWKGDLLTLSAVAAFSRSEQSVGVMTGKTGGSYTHLFTVNQFGYLPAMSATIDNHNNFFRFVLDNSGSSLRSSTLASENPFGDQVVTYRIDGLGGPWKYMLFWEDAPIGNSDQDYNDLALEASFAGTGGPAAVPLPPAVWMGLVTMGGIGLMMYRNQQKRLLL